MCRYLTGSRCRTRTNVQTAVFVCLQTTNNSSFQPQASGKILSTDWLMEAPPSCGSTLDQSQQPIRELHSKNKPFTKPLKLEEHKDARLEKHTSHMTSTDSSMLTS